MKRYIITALSLLSTAYIANAQSAGELYRFSNQNTAMGSARSTAMAGAYTSLGADPIAMSINPAGLAMYRSSEVSATPAILINNNSLSSSYNKNTVKFAFPNIAGVYTGKNYSLGVAMNRLADFSGSKYYRGQEQQSSIGQMYAQQLQGMDVDNIKTPEDNINTYRPFFNNNPSMWNAIMAYQTGLVDNIGGTNYGMNGIFNSGDKLTPDYYSSTRGAINEFIFSGAYNYNDFLYFGLSLGFQDLYFHENFNYSEVTSIGNTGNYDNMTYRNNMNMSGFGFNMKLGVTVRPTPWLRIGVAYHTPTWMTVQESSYADMTVYDFRYLTPAFSDTPELLNDYQMRSPSRLMAGLSFTIAKKFIVSADYECTWYGNMKYTTPINIYGYRVPNTSNPVDNLQNAADNLLSNGDIDLNNVIKTYYQPAHTVKIGIEAQPAKGFFIRAGYSYTSSPYKNVSNEIYNTNLSGYGALTTYTGGLGYRIKLFGIDVTYAYRQSSSLPEKFYTYIGNNGQVTQSSAIGYNLLTAHQILMTLSFKI